MRQKHPRFAGIAFALLVGATLLSTVGSCTPDARYARCSNGGECQKRDPKYEYCLDGRCVECIGRGGCGAHRACRDGACVEGEE
jgi:hypothetical protein